MDQELADLVAAFRETLENFREWREEHARYFEALRPIRSQLDKQSQERDRLRADGRQEEVLKSWENSVALMEKEAGPGPGFPPPLKGLEREAMKQLKWWHGYLPQNAAEVDRRHETLWTLSALLRCIENIHRGQPFATGVDPAVLPWATQGAEAPVKRPSPAEMLAMHEKDPKWTGRALGEKYWPDQTPKAASGSAFRYMKPARPKPPKV